MEQDPLNENLAWGDGEDVEWSMRVRDKYKYVMNTNSVVEILRPNKNISSYYVEGDEKYEDSSWIDEWKL